MIDTKFKSNCMKLNISGKIILIAVSGVIASGLTILCITIILMSRLLDFTIQKELTAIQSMIKRMQQQDEDRLLKETELLTSLPDLADAVQRSDTESIRRNTYISWLSREIDSISFTDSNGIVIFRSHSDLKEDDISSRRVIQSALKGQISSGFFFDETALVPYTINCFSPIYKDGILIGALSLGLNIASEEYADNLYNLTGIHFSLYKNDITLMTSLKDRTGRRNNGAKLEDDRITDTVLKKGENIIVQSDFFGSQYMTLYWPIKDYNGETIGMWANTMPMDLQTRETNKVLLIILLCSLGIISIFTIAASILGNRISIPVRKITKFAVRVADGNLDDQITVHSNDELGQLSGALNTMVTTLKERINEEEKLHEIAKQRLKNMDELMHAILDATPFGAMLWDKNLNITYCNQALVRIFKLSSKKECLNNFQFFSPEYQPDGRKSDEKLSFLIKKAFEAELIQSEWIHKASDGELIECEGTLVRISYKDDYLVAGFIRDLREQKAREREAEEQREAAVAANKAKSTFLSTMSHEIRTPMNAIIGITEIQLRNENLAPDAVEAFEKIYSSSDMLMSIINDILDLSKIESGKLELLEKNYEFASMISDTVRLNMTRIGSKIIEFELNVDENIPVTLLGDELRIKQILNNLLSNAFKYTEAGKVTLSAAIDDNKTSGDKVLLIFTVKDTGHGMTKEQVEKLFEEYARFNQEANSTKEGTGLGMPITRNLINMMDGKIFVESEIGKGSVFTIHLLQGKVNSDVIGSEMAENLNKFRMYNSAYIKKIQVSIEPMPYGRVLIVDDVDTNIYVAKGLILPYALKEIDSANSGADALRKIQNGNVYDVIFMDHMMPGMDGIETVRRIREAGYKEPIVALTANAVGGKADIFMQNNFNDFISKPIDMRQLNVIMNTYVRDKQPQEVIDEARKQAHEKQQKNEKPLEPLFSDSIFSGIEIKGLDIEKGFKRFDGNDKIFFDVLRSYAAGVSSMLDTIETVSEDTLTEYIIKVHGIKGISFDVFAQQIAEEAKNLEEAGMSGDMEFINKNHSTFMENARNLVSGIKEILTNINSESEKPLSDKPDIKQLHKLIKACNDYDMGGAEKAMTELEKYRYESDNDLIGWLRDSIDRMQFEEIVEKLKG
ncbi:MAG: ATP-binding protein [Treponema sp.]|nr:ATP-binding protein [Treponema sp.]MCL2251166.1 ATP-binding protein [Treponema sp.]